MPPNENATGGFEELPGEAADGLSKAASAAYDGLANAAVQAGEWLIDLVPHDLVPELVTLPADLGGVVL